MTNETLAQKYQAEWRNAEEALELANVYIQDGAFSTGAAHLRKAAEHFDQAAKIKQAAFGGRP
jgi:hypothetical protein